MILYLDTRSLVKLYVDEPGADAVRGLVDRAEIVAASVVAYPEARGALARRRRERSLSPTAHRRAKAALDADWPRILALDVSSAVAGSAGDLAERLRLRGFDALHLASYLVVAREFSDDDVVFSSAVRALERAAGRVRPRQGRARGKRR